MIYCARRSRRDGSICCYSVSWRTHEIGIRMALGAKRADVLRLVIRQGMTMTLIGLALGLVGAFAMSRVIAGLLFGVSPKDPLTLAGVSIVLLPRVNPIVALRSE